MILWLLIFTLLVNYITDSTSNEEQYEAVEFFVDAGLNYARRNNIVMPNSYVLLRPSNVCVLIRLFN